MLVQDDQPILNTTGSASVIIEDLLKNKPSGPSSITLTYLQKEEWCPDKCGNIIKSIPSHKHFGYDKKILFNLGMKSLDDVKKVLRKHKFDNRYVIGGKRRTYTRQCNRLWKRLSPAINEVLQEGGQGGYRVIHKSVKSAYTLRETSVGFVYAADYNEAVRIARLMFGYLVNDPENLETVFSRFGSKEDLMKYNTRAIEKIDTRIKEVESSLEHMKDKIKKLENMRHAVLNVTLSMCGNNAEEQD